MFEFEKKLSCYPQKVEALGHGEYGKTLSTVLLYLNSGICNQDCTYCDKNFYKIECKRFTKDMLENLIEDMCRMGADSLIILGEGGEPIIDANLPWLINEAAKKNIACGIYTNGSICSAEIVDSFNKLEFLRISLDAGTSLTHRKIHRYPNERNDFDNCIELLKAINKEKVMIGVAYIILNENIDEIYTAWELLNELNVDYMELKLPLQKDYRYEKVEQKDIIKIRDVLKKISAVKKKNTRVVLNKHLELVIADECKSDELTSIEPRLCLTSCLRTIVSPLGYFLCSPLKNIAEYKYGNPYDERLISAWNGEKRRELFKKICDIRCTYYGQNEALASILDGNVKLDDSSSLEILQKHFL